MNGAPEPFELRITIEAGDIDELGHVNNVVYLRWVQNVAVAHWKALAPVADQENLLWVVVRHEIDYKQPAFLGDEIIARTWVGNTRRIRFERHTEILRARDRLILAKAITLWCPIDPHTGKLSNVSTEVKTLFAGQQSTEP